MRVAPLAAALIFAPLAMLGAGPAAAQSGCAAIYDDLDRLDCYDRERIARERAREDRGVARGYVQEWELEARASPVDGRRNVWLTLASRNDQPVDTGGAAQAHLVIACRENNTSMHFLFPEHLVTDRGDWGRVAYRVDGRKATVIRMFETPDNKGLGLWRGKQAIPYVKKMIGGDLLVMSVKPYQAEPITYVFDIAGLDEAIGPLRKSCHW